MLLFAWLVAGSVATSAVDGQGTREVLDFNQGWRFHLGDVPSAKDASFDDATWRTVDVPHDFSAEAAFAPTNASGTGFLPGGVGWYRKSFVLTDAPSPRHAFIEFEGVMRNSDVWLNGVHLGHRPNGYIGFHYDLTPHVRFGGATNSLVVRCERENVADSRWYPGTGLYRSVRLTSMAPLHIPLWGVFVTTPRITPETADVVVQVDVRNEWATNCSARVVVRILDPQGAEVSGSRQEHEFSAGETYTFSLWQQVPLPQRWSVETPTLYTAVCQVLLGETQVDETHTRFGIREVRFDADRGFFLNGVNVKLKGLCLHHDAGALGAAVPAAVLERRLHLVKGLGANAVRCSHNPMAPEFYDLCDRLGLLVLDEAFDEWEIGKRKWVAGRNVGRAQRFGYSEDFEEWAERDCADMVRRSRNHPSIIAWSLGNEIDYPTDPYVLEVTRAVEGFERDAHAPRMTRLAAVAPRLIATVKQHDPTRPVTMALANQPATDAIGLAQMLDVVGYNYQEAAYESVHRQFPGRIILGSETGKGYEAWLAVMQNDYVAGQFLWVGFDFLGEAGEWPGHGSSAGLFDTRGFPKAEALQRQAWWSDRPVLNLAVSSSSSERSSRRLRGMRAHWNWGEATAPVHVVAFSNGEEVELRLNGRLLGTQPVGSERSTTFSVSYEPGVLEAIGRTGGREVTRARLRTAGTPTQLRIQQAPEDVSVEADEVVQVIISVVDTEGVLVPDADLAVTVEVHGAGRLLALDNGDLWDPTALQSATKRVRGGQLLGVVKVAGEGGDSVMRATAEGVMPAAMRWAH